MNRKIKLLIKCVIVLIIAEMLNWMSFDDVHSYTRIMLHEMREQGGNIDELAVGGSEVFKAYDSKRISKDCNIIFFNAGSASQQLGGSMAMIRECEAQGGLKTVYLDMGFQRNQGDEEGDLQTYILTDFMRRGRNRYKYLWESQGIRGIENDILPCIHRTGKPWEMIKSKLSKPYRLLKYDYVSYDTERYMGDGFVYGFRHADEDTDYRIAEDIDPSHVMSDYAKRKLDEITQYCKDNKIMLILVETPLPDSTLLKENYQPYVSFMQSYAESKGLEYWNFNLIKKEYLSLGYEDYSDEAHLSGAGAVKFTDTFSRVRKELLSEKIQSNNVFYNTYLEKIQNNADETVR